MTKLLPNKHCDFMSTTNRKIRAGLIGGLIGGLSGGVAAFAACQRTSDFKWLIPFSAAFLAGLLGAVTALVVRRAMRSHKQAHYHPVRRDQ
jgi:hypothetical protein